MVTKGLGTLHLRFASNRKGTRKRQAARSRLLWNGHGYNIAAACFGFIEALVRDF